MELSTTALQAIQLVHQGQGLNGDDLMVGATNAALDQHGPRSIEYARALYEHAIVCITDRNRHEAIEFLNQAVAATPGDTAGERLRAKLQAELGTIYLDRDELESAHEAFAQCVELRQHCFGIDHPEYASALLDMAEVQLRQGQSQEAVTLADNAIRIFEPILDVLTFDSIAISSLARLSLEIEQPDLTALKNVLNPADLDIMADRIIAKLSCYTHYSQFCVLIQLLAFLDSFEEYFTSTRIKVLEQIAFHARGLEDYKSACKYWEQCEALGREIIEEDPWAFLNARFEWAKTLQLAGDYDSAETMLIETLSKTQKMKKMDMLSDSLRHYARLLAKTGRLKDAEHYLNEGIKAAKKHGGANVQALSLTDYGVFLSHCGRYEQAIEALKTADSLNSELHHVHEKIENHLHVKSDSDVCGCFGDVDVQELWSNVQAEADPGGVLSNIIDQVEITPSGGISVQLSREPSAAEETLLDQFTLQLMNVLDEARTKLNSSRLRQSGLR